MPINKVKDKSGKLVKKDGLQKYRVRINYTDTSGRNKQLERTAYGMDEAKRLELELTHQLKKATPAEKMTVRELYDKYQKAKQYEVRESSNKKSYSNIKNHILPTLGNIKIGKLNTTVLQEWKELIESKNLSIRTRKNIYSDFRTVLNWAVKMDYLPKNPLSKVGNFKAPLELKKEMLFYEPDEIQKYLSAARTIAEQSNELADWSYYVFFCIAIYGGLRKGEIYALTWADVQNGIIDITKSINQRLPGDDRITPPKNASSVRKIQIPTPLQTVLDEHYNRCRSMFGFDDNYYICGGKRPVRDASVTTVNRRIAKLAAVKRIRIHDFRHTHASLLIHYNISIQEVARRLGHADINTTIKTYAHLYPSETERALQVLNNMDFTS